jgi:hypothetical protein
MLVVASDIAEAEEVRGILKDPSFFEGRYAEKVLTVHSNAPDEALAALEVLDEPESMAAVGSPPSPEKPLAEFPAKVEIVPSLPTRAAKDRHRRTGAKPEPRT